MKKALIASALCICTLFVVVPGQVKAADTVKIGVELALPIPMLDWDKAAGFGFGGFGKFEFYFNPNLGLTFRLGYLHHLEKNGVTSNELPILVGGKYVLDFGLFAELAFGVGRMAADAGPISVADWEPEMMLAIGYEIFGFNIGANFWFPDIEHIDDAMAIMFTIGWSFGF
jgi:hypothetical protein